MVNLWKKFKQNFPNVDMSRFTIKSWFDDIFYTSNDGREKIAVFDDTKLNSPSYSEEMKHALGIINGFPKGVDID